MEKLIQTYTQAGTNLKPAELQRSVDCWNEFVSWTEVEGMRIPKRHLCAHLVSRARHFGNPKRYCNWRDEALKRDLKMAPRLVHCTTFEALSFREALRQASKRKQVHS